MEIIKIEKQPTVADYIRAMELGDIKRFDLSHERIVREHASRTMKIEKPEYSFPTEVNYELGYIEVVMKLKEVTHAAV